MDSKIKEIEIQSNFLEEILYDSFKNCTELEKIEFPMGGTLHVIGTNAFYNCPKLEALNLPNGLLEFKTNSVGCSYAIYGCNSLTEIVFPDTIERLGTCVVDSCANIKKVVLPGKLRHSYIWTDQTITQSHMDDDNNIVTDIPNIPYLIVTNCPKIESLTLPAFSYNEEDTEGNITNVNINDWVMNVSRWVIRADLSSRLPSTDVYLLDSASKQNIKEILISNVDNGNRYVSANGAIYTADKSKLLRGPWNVTEFEIEPEAVDVDGYAFDSSKLTTLIGGENLRTVGTCAFAGLGNFISSGFIENLTVIGEKSFQNTGLREVTIGSGITSIGEHAFDGVTNMEKLTFKGGFSQGGQIGRFAFNGCGNLKTVIVSANEAPKLAYIANNGVEQKLWHPFYGVGQRIPIGKELIISHKAKETFLKEPSSAASRTTYMLNEETTWRYFVSGLTSGEVGLGFSIKNIYLSGLCDVTIYKNGVPYTADVYAVSENWHLGVNGDTYVAPNIDGSYIFDVTGLYDRETVSAYSGSHLYADEFIGSFTPNMITTEYQIGSPSFGAGNRSITLSSESPSESEGGTEEVTKADYDALVSKVNQMMKIIKNLSK